MTNYKKHVFIIAAMIFAVTTLYAEHPLVLESSTLKLNVYPQTGHFTLYRIVNTGSGTVYESLFDDRNNGTSSRFSISVNKEIYHLETKVKNGKVQGESDEKHILLTFKLASNFTVKQKFYFIDQTFDDDGAALQIETTIENTSEEAIAAVLYAVFDTTLGEPIERPFFTNNFKEIASETKFEPSNPDDVVVISSNDRVAALFFLNSETTTPPSYAQAAHWNHAFFQYQPPLIVPGRDFTTADRPNDSALLFAWPVRIINSGYRSTISMIIGSSDNNTMDYPVFTKTGPIKDENDTSRPDTAIAAPLIGMKTENEGSGSGSSNKKQTKQEKRLELARLLRNMERALENPDDFTDEELNQLYKEGSDGINKFGE